jgi:hypothetical protein
MHRIGVFVLRSVKLIEPPAGRSTALVFRCADGRFALSSAKNAVQIPQASSCFASVFLFCVK